MRTTYQNTSMRFRFFRACAFRAKNPECYGFFWQCKRYVQQKTQVFWILVFANVNGPTILFSPLYFLYSKWYESPENFEILVNSLCAFFANQHKSHSTKRTIIGDEFINPLNHQTCTVHFQEDITVSASTAKIK